MTDHLFFGADHAAVFENWNRRGFAYRCKLLRAALDQLPLAGDHEEQLRLIPLLLDRALHMDRVVSLPGPTGESNELYLSGRGDALVFGTEGASCVALAGQVFSALACGNPVLLGGAAEQEWCSRLVTLLHQIGVPRGILTLTDDTPVEALMQLPHLALVAPVCQGKELPSFQRQLAERQGLLVQLVPETDAVRCTTLLQPDHLHRFVTEKTRTINTTAVGGNATLLELGSSAA
ncbi:MAG: delta 1-pyrroline-5-carboxylate dehydrogenase [Oceanospirillales bacterium]|nr:delta 1-pyrroline-5-carboxylate dehydrogenase [Oceanospirillales bacterium]